MESIGHDMKQKHFNTKDIKLDCRDCEAIRRIPTATGPSTSAKIPEVLNTLAWLLPDYNKLWVARLYS